MARSTGWRLRRTDLQLAWKGISTRFDKSSLSLNGSPDWQGQHLDGNLIHFGMYTSLTPPTRGPSLIDDVPSFP